jgi:hypothetical protein
MTSADVYGNDPYYEDSRCNCRMLTGNRRHLEGCSKYNPYAIDEYLEQRRGYSFELQGIEDTEC